MSVLDQSLLRRDIQSLAHFITALESDSPAAQATLKKSWKRRRPALRIGVTGPAGSGKSTLLDKLIAWYRGKKKTVAVIAIDPSSPATGGAFLGDRIRMQRHARDKGVYIRSMANRAAVGGIAPALDCVLGTLEIFGFDVILIETIGAGQSDTALRPLCSPLLVLAPPDSVDIVQAMKSGLMEIADILVISKADLPGADHAAKTFQQCLTLRGAQQRHVVCVSALKNSGIEELTSKIAEQARNTGTGYPLYSFPKYGDTVHPEIQDGSLHHVAIAVHRIKDHLPLYAKTLGMEHEGTFTLREYSVRIAALKLPNARIELIEPAGPRSTLTKFLAKRGEGLHHVAFQVADLPRRVTDLKRSGLKWINEQPRPGLHGSGICFLHPSSAKGILLEFVE